MITIYIHAGAAKTGSSAIQAFLNYNRENLIKNNSCLYPNYNSTRIDKGHDCHNHCKSINTPNHITIVNDIEKSVGFCKKHNISSIIISAEGFFVRPDIGKKIFERFQNDADLSFRIIIFLRRQDNFLESAWKQWGSKDRRFTSIEDYIQVQKIEWLDYLREFRTVFGKENVIVHPYEAQQMQDGLIAEFLKFCGIPYSKYTWVTPPESNLNTNVGFNRDVIEILALNKSFNKNIHDNTLLNFFYTHLPETYQKKPYEHYDFLSPEERINILRKYDEMNQTIACEFLGREDGRLFYEPWPDPHDSWKPYEGLTVEKIVPIFVQMLYSIDRHHTNKLKELQERSFRKSVRLSVVQIKKRIRSFFS